MAMVDIDYRVEVLSMLWNEPGGMTMNAILAEFKAREQDQVIGAIWHLVGRGKLLRARRLHAQFPDYDHERLVVPGRLS